MEVSLNSNNGIPYSYDNLNNIGINPYVVAVLIIVVVAYYILFSTLGSSAGSASVSSYGTLLGSSSGSSSGSGLKILEIILWGLFILLLILNGMTYIFNTSVTATLKNIFTTTPEVDIILDSETPSAGMPSTVPEITRKPQVFHIPGNNYTFEDSKAICSAYGGRLATYSEMEDSYKEGADWCSFGWSDGQMAFYPTQTDKWEKLQKIEGHEHDCGRPGINGGYIDNPNVRFGANCFGYKPVITEKEMNQMGNTPLYPKTNKELQFDKNVDMWRKKLSEITVAPFNNKNWSII
jgi:hypothetical protein